MDAYAVTLQTWNEVAQVYQDKFMHLDLYNDSYDLFCAAVAKPHAKVLELGCGPGNITRHLLARRSDFDITGTDVAPAMVELAKANNPKARFSVLDCRELHTLGDSNYDGIVCGFCLPYLSQADGTKLIKDCAALLPSGGSLYLSTIEGDYGQSGYQTGSTGHQVYVYYYPANFLTQTLYENGFTLTHLLRKQYDGQPEPHIIIIAQKK